MWWDSGSSTSWMTNFSQLRQDSEEEDDDEDAAECLRKQLNCEATTSESQSPKRAAGRAKCVTRDGE